jgi:hypothetical protein
LPLKLSLPSGDITRMREYLSGRFRKERELIADYASKVQRDPTPHAVLELSARALAFRHELVSWQAFAERLYDEGHAAQIVAVREVTRAEIELDKTARRSVKEIETIVRGQIAPLKQALELITLTADQMKNVVFWAQAMARILSSEEHLERHTSAAEFDESLFIIPVVGGDAPIDEALRRLEDPPRTDAGQLVIDSSQTRELAAGAQVDTPALGPEPVAKLTDEQPGDPTEEPTEEAAERAVVPAPPSQRVAHREEPLPEGAVDWP